MADPRFAVLEEAARQSLGEGTKINTEGNVFRAENRTGKLTTTITASGPSDYTVTVTDGKKTGYMHRGPNGGDGQDSDVEKIDKRTLQVYTAFRAKLGSP